MERRKLLILNLCVLLLFHTGFIGLVLANKPVQQPIGVNDPYDGVFKIPSNQKDQSNLPETDQDYIQHKDKQDEFDWKLTKVRIICTLFNIHHLFLSSIKQKLLLFALN